MIEGNLYFGGIMAQGQEKEVTEDGDVQRPIHAKVRLIFEQKSAASNHSKGMLDELKLFVELLRVLCWPLLIATLIGLYHAPLGTALESLAEKISEADSIHLSLKELVIEKARELGNDDLAEKIGKLSSPAIEELLQTPKAGQYILIGTGERDGRKEYTIPKKVRLDALGELESKGFVKFEESLKDFLAFFNSFNMTIVESPPDRDSFVPKRQLSEAESRRLLAQGYELTASGRQAVDAVVKAVTSQLKANTKERKAKEIKDK